MTLTNALAQVAPPGGGTTGGTPGGGGNFVLTTVSTDTGQSVTISPFGSSNNPSTRPEAYCSIYGIPGSVTAKCKGKRKITVTWVGGGTPPQYAYVLLTSMGRYSTEGSPGGTGTIDLGLPLDVSIFQTDPEAKSGRKVAKLKLDSGGKAEYTIEGGVEITAVSNAANGFFGENEARWGGSASLQLKALGLFTDPTFKRTETPPANNGEGPPVVERILDDSDDFENQTCTLGMPLRVLGTGINTTKEGFLSRVFGVDYKGNFSHYLENFNSGVTLGTRQEEKIGIYPFRQGSTITTESICSVSELKDMRTNPKIITVSADANDTLGVGPLAGPFYGKMKMYVWATQRLLGHTDVVENGSWGRVLVKGPNNTFQTSVLLATIGETAGLEASFGSSTTYKFPVTVTGGASASDPFGILTVGFDIGKQVGEEQSFDIQTNQTFTAGPCTNPVEEWAVQMRFQTPKRIRYLSKYDSTGYVSDYSDVILNSGTVSAQFMRVKLSSGGTI